VRYSLLAAALLAGCAVQPSTALPPQIPTSLTSAPPKHIEVPPDPLNALAPDVRQAVEANQRPTLHHGITTVFAYSPDMQWTVYCQPLRVTEIQLSPDEHAKKNGVDIGDSARWGVEIGDQTVMVKPLADASDKNMTTNLVIHTDHRSYHLLLRLSTRFMPAIAWYYPDDVKTAQAARQVALKALAAEQLDQPAPAKLNCAYLVIGDAPWKPTEVCDNGQNELIGLTDAPGTDAPTLMVLNGKQQEVVNYTQDGQWLKTDRLFKRAMLVSGVGANRQLVHIEAQ
jgi:P-type conjugative transfer protein TrbG